jgi:hypothetical protein
MSEVQEYCDKCVACDNVQFHTVAIWNAAHVTATQPAAQVSSKL